MTLPERTEHWARALTAIPSITGSADEAAFAGRFAALLRTSDAFAGVADSVWTIDVPGGAHPRQCVLALARGSGRRTIVLTGHFDIVDTANYGALQPLALDPDRLREALIAAIREEPHDVRSAKALADLESGDFLPGRGLLDMKAGLAAGLAVIEAMAADGFVGNLLFIGVPDEEGNSAGARTVSRLLDGVARERGLDIEAVINLDATGDEGDGEDGRVVMLGSVGKLLPSALVIGRATHAADAFKGIGAAALAGALATEMEWLPELTERSGDELGAPPTLLGMKDEKTFYDVTTPASVWMTWNVMTHRRAPDAVLDAVAGAAARAADGLMSRLARRAENARVPMPAQGVPVLRFEALLTEVTAANADATRVLSRLSDELAKGATSLPEQCRVLTEALWRMSGRTGPAIVLGFASIPYLPVELRDGEAASRLASAVDEARAAIAARHATTIGAIRYFPGISDMSFFGEADETHVATIAANTPQWRGIVAGHDGFGAAGIACVNVGPWGRDYHTRLERMHTGYGFRVLPHLVMEIVRRFFDAPR